MFVLSSITAGILHLSSDVLSCKLSQDLTLLQPPQSLLGGHECCLGQVQHPWREIIKGEGVIKLKTG